MLTAWVLREEAQLDELVPNLLIFAKARLRDDFPQRFDLRTMGGRWFRNTLHENRKSELNRKQERQEELSKGQEQMRDTKD